MTRTRRRGVPEQYERCNFSKRVYTRRGIQSAIRGGGLIYTVQWPRSARGRFQCLRLARHAAATYLRKLDGAQPRRRRRRRRRRGVLNGKQHSDSLDGDSPRYEEEEEEGGASTRRDRGLGKPVLIRNHRPDPSSRTGGPGGSGRGMGGPRDVISLSLTSCIRNRYPAPRPRRSHRLTSATAGPPAK